MAEVCALVNEVSGMYFHGDIVSEGGFLIRGKHIMISWNFLQSIKFALLPLNQ